MSFIESRLKVIGKQILHSVCILKKYSLLELILTLIHKYYECQICKQKIRDLISIKNVYIFLVYLQLSHLYSMFAKQVKDYCKDKHNANVSQCKRNMMVYGMEKLNDMEESHLDKMDPYQRDADNIRKLSLI